MKRVVITGIGLVTPNGIGTSESWAAISAGRSGIAPITLFDASAFASRMAGEVKGFDPLRFIEKKKVREMARFIQLSMAATSLAVADAALELRDEERERAGAFIGVGLGGLENIEAAARTLFEKGPDKISPYFIPSTIANLAAGQISMAWGLCGPTYANTSACSSSAHSVGEAFEWIRRGRASVMIAGGAEATVAPLSVGGFCAMRALSKRNDAPESASRPFDRGRDGFVIGEGAGTLVLETLERARARGARVYAEIVGYGAASDAYHLTQPAPEGVGAQRAMRMALEDAGVAPDDVDYVNAHGTSTPQGDVQESRAIAQVFGARATSGELWVSSTKSVMGHLLGAAGAVEAAISALAIHEAFVPPTAHLDDPDPECALDYVAHHGRPRAIRRALSNSFGFGGTNATLLFSRVES